MIEALSTIHGRILGATDEEIACAAETVRPALAHALFDDARKAARHNKCRREVPVTSRDDDGVLTEGIVDLAFEQANGWTVIDFKTDEEFRGNEAAYRRQVGLYAAAISAAMRMPASAILMRL